MDWLASLGGIAQTAAQYYVQEKNKAATAKQAMMDFQLQKQQLNAQIASSNAQAAQAQAASAPPPKAGLPKWVIPTAVAGVVGVGLLIAFRPRSA